MTFTPEFAIKNSPEGRLIRTLNRGYCRRCHQLYFGVAKGVHNFRPALARHSIRPGDCLSSPSGTSGRINQGEPRRCASTGRTSGNSPKYRSFRNLFVYHSRVSSGSVGIFPSKPLFSAWLWPRNIDSPSEEGRFHIATTCPVSGSFMFLHHNYPSLLSIAVISRHC